tara:strand:+ start:224 stop:661 length:438 start_codon:yes stop_codon:yes gene_type:complete
MTTRLPSSPKQQPNTTAMRRRNTVRGSILGTTARRDMIAAQLALDKDIFDPSLGCPLSSFENATIGLVGGKALQCWRLTKHGYNIPASFIIPTYVYSLHVNDAGTYYFPHFYSLFEFVRHLARKRENNFQFVLFLIYLFSSFYSL